MIQSVDFSKLKTSWTKYDIVQVMQVISSVETIEKFKNKEGIIDEPILRSFLGVKSLEDITPDYWIEIQNYPNEKPLFALLSLLFTHGEIIEDFADQYSQKNMKGVFKTSKENGKRDTNIRSALIESGVTEFTYRRTELVPYDFSPIFQNINVGKLFKKVLLERLSRISQIEITDSNFYEICFSNKFHLALSITELQFKAWLEGIPLDSFNGSLIQTVSIANFFSIEKAKIDLGDSKEIYFLGENGDGKSLLLMAIYLAFNGNYIIKNTDQEKTGKAADILRNDMLVQLHGRDNKGQEYHPQKGTYLNNFFAYGTHRGRYSSDRPEEYGFMSLFDSEQTLLNPTTWLKNQKLLELENNLNANNSVGEIKEIPAYFPFEVLEKIFFDLLEKNVVITIDGSNVYFKEKGTYLTFDQLSEGYRSILIFVSDLLYRLNKNANGKSISDLRGIVLVDEIDLHLHPKWQRVIIGKLRKIFPNIQFIFTTHSPTIIQGASGDAIIFRVYRNKEDGNTKISEPYFRKDLDHLMINTLVTSPLFGLEDARMNTEDEDSDTNDSYLLYRINNILEEELQKQKLKGKTFIDKNEIDTLIKKIIKEELSKK